MHSILKVSPTSDLVHREKSCG